VALADGHGLGDRLGEPVERDGDVLGELAAPPGADRVRHARRATPQRADLRRTPARAPPTRPSPTASSSASRPRAASSAVPSASSSSRNPSGSAPDGNVAPAARTVPSSRYSIAAGHDAAGQHPFESRAAGGRVGEQRGDRQRGLGAGSSRSHTLVMTPSVPSEPTSSERRS
jgi:hypothetical protein